MKTSLDICNKAKEIASFKTMYLKKGKGQKLTPQNKMWFSSIDAFNAKKTSQISAAPEETRGYDEFGFFLKVAGYNCRIIGEIMALCEDISKDFSTIVPGEVVFMKDRFGIFVGDGKVITVDSVGVGETIIDGWVSHGKLPEVAYSAPEPSYTEEPIDIPEVAEIDDSVSFIPHEEIRDAESRMEIRSNSFRRRH